MDSPAGWYDDGSGNERWWDGSAWTEDVQAETIPSSEEPIMSFVGTNDEGQVNVNVFPNRLEWEQNVGLGLSAKKLAAGFMTGGFSLAATGVGRGSYKRTKPTVNVLRLDSVSAVTSKHDGRLTAITIRTPSMSLTWKINKERAREVIRTLHHLVDSAKTGAGQSQPQVSVNIAGQGAGAAGDSGADMLGRLEQLAQLHSSGVLSEEEFKAAKARLLGL